MNRRKVYLICLVVALIIFGSRIVYADEAWNEKMRRVAVALNNLLPFISETDSRTPLERPDQLAEVEKLNKAVASLKGEIQKHGSAKSKELSDPLFPMLVDDFSLDVERALKAYKAGHVQYARSILRGSTAYCTGCHTRTENSKDFKFPVFPELVKDLSLSEQMKFMAANRRFDDSLKLFDNYLSSKELRRMDNFEFESAVKLAVSIMVRVQPNAGPAIDLLNRVKKSDLTSEEFAKELKGWDAALSQWKDEKEVKVANESDYFARGKELFSRAQKRQDYPFDRNADVDYLRATALLHQLLGKYPASKNLSEVYFMLGKSYEVLQDLGFWSLHEHYYEACIRMAPRTAVASECYQNYSDSVTMGFTGSRGTLLPPEVKSKLTQLKKLSELKPVQKQKK